MGKASLALAVSLAIIGLFCSPLFAGTVEFLVSGTQPVISANGGHMAFVDSRDGVYGIFVYDLETGDIVQASDNTIGYSISRWSSQSISISSDGRHVAYSAAKNGRRDIYLYDSQTGETLKIDLSAYGISYSHGLYPRISGDGSRLAFYVDNQLSHLPGMRHCLPRILLVDIQTGSLACVEFKSNADGLFPQRLSMSEDGARIAFDVNKHYVKSNYIINNYDSYVYDFMTGKLRALTNGGVRSHKRSHNPSISADGEYVAYAENGNNITISSITTGKKEHMDRGSHAVISSGARFVAYYSTLPDDDYRWGAIYFYDRERDIKELVSTYGRDFSMSADGRYVVFTKNYDPGIFIYVRGPW
jgi:Tol biopolymer transport system component